MELTEFSELEKKIKNLLGDYAQLKKSYQELEDILKNKESALKEANSTIRGLTEEKDAVRTKVDSLLELLQDIQVPH
jgi:chromosome segregation ATPase